MTSDLRSLAVLFLRLGTTAFGGPAAHIAMMEDEVVRRRHWMSREEFLDLVGASHLIPGPNSTELAIHVGYARAGWAGLLVAGSCFILPALVIVWMIAWGYERSGSLPEVTHLLTGVRPVVLAVVAHALWGFAQTALKSALTLALCVAGFVVTLLGVHELVVLATAALIALVDARVTEGGNPPIVSALSLVQPLAESAPGGASASGLSAAAVGAAGAGAVGATSGLLPLWPLFLVFLKAGSFLFGSGYVLLAFLRTDLVVRLGWLTESQLLDAIAVGQVTPGPVFTTATFIGYILSGHWGALIATLGIFLPAFVFVALTAPVVRRMRSNPTLRAALNGLNAASLALMAAVCLPLGRDALQGPGRAIPIFLLALLLLVRWRVNTAWLVLGGGVAGLLLGL